MKKFSILILGFTLSAVLWSCSGPGTDRESQSKVSGTVKILNTEFVGSAKNGKILVEGIHYSDTPISEIVVFHDPVGSEGNSVRSVASVYSNGIFSVESPISDFGSSSGEYRLRIIANYQNGGSDTFTYNYSLSDGIPNFSTIKTQMLDTRPWTAIYVSSEGNGSGKEKMIDGDVSTYWHTRWKTGYDNFPFTLVVDTATKTDVEGFAFYTRNETKGTINEFELFKSDDNDTWTSMGSFNLKEQRGWQYITLPERNSMRYVKIVIKSSHRSQEEISIKDTYTHLAELGAF